MPFATPLRRSDFLEPDFSPATYLSTLHNRHQTLEDLRSELRSRSQLLSKELLDLVNSNYQDFLNLGNSLHGGEERIEEVRVGLLGFRKEVGALQKTLVEREEEVRGLLDNRVDIRSHIEIGRQLIDYDARLKELEAELLITSSAKGTIIDGEEVSDSEEEEDEEEDDNDNEAEEDGARSYGVPIAKLKQNVTQYKLVQELEKKLGEHPFLAAQGSRMAKVRSTLLMDLNTALQKAKNAGANGSVRLVKILSAYSSMDESAEAVKVLQAAKIM